MKSLLLLTALAVHAGALDTQNATIKDPFMLKQMAGVGDTNLDNALERGKRNLSTEIDILEAQLQLVRSDEEDF